MFKSTLIGHLTADPVVKTVNGNQLTEFCVAARTARKGSDKEFITNFVNVTVFGSQGDFIANHAKKGTKVYVDGNFAVVAYTNKEGAKGQSLNLTASSVELMTPPGAKTPTPSRNQASAMPDYDGGNDATDPFA